MSIRNFDYIFLLCFLGINLEMRVYNYARTYLLVLKEEVVQVLAAEVPQILWFETQTERFPVLFTQLPYGCQTY